MTEARKPGLLWPAVMTGLALLVLLALGFWQLERLKEKEAMLADIDAGLAAAPVPLPGEIENPGDWAWRAVTIEGVLDHDRELFLYARNLAGQVGYHVLTPLIRTDGAPVLVDRGWVPPDRKAADARIEGQVDGRVVLTGIARLPETPGPFVPDPDPGERVWYGVDLVGMQAALRMNLAPVIVQADGTPNPGGFPVGGQTRIDIPNNHLDYALTWFGLAVVLAVIFVVYWRRRR